MRFTKRGRELFFDGQSARIAGIYAGVGDRSTSDSLDPPFEDDFARLVRNHNNLHRHWLTPYWNFSPVGVDDTLLARNAIFLRSTPPHRPGGVWNLLLYNDGYFQRLEQMIAAAAKAGVVVQLVIFDHSGLIASMPGEAPVRRWDDNPWNHKNNLLPFIDAPLGVPAFFGGDPGLRNAQQRLIETVVDRTHAHWNVFYEIMNEPQGGSPGERAQWADWVVGVIHARTGGGSMIFYNDHAGGADVTFWKNHGLANYDRFHGVIFHARPHSIDPEPPRGSPPPYVFTADKIFQVSTDGVKDIPTNDMNANAEWSHYCFQKKMLFQAESVKESAAQGIAASNPTRLA